MRQKKPLRAETHGSGNWLSRMDAEFPGLIGGRGDYTSLLTATHDDRPSFQVRIIQNFNSSVEGIHVEMNYSFVPLLSFHVFAYVPAPFASCGSGFLAATSTEVNLQLVHNLGASSSLRFASLLSPPYVSRPVSRSYIRWPI